MSYQLSRLCRVGANRLLLPSHRIFPSKDLFLRRDFNWSHYVSTGSIHARRGKLITAAATCGVTLALAGGVQLLSSNTAKTDSKEARLVSDSLPREQATLAFAPNVPPPVERRYPAHVIVKLDTTVELAPLSRQNKYRMWTFNCHVPGPFIRARQGDTLEVRFTNRDEDGLAHNIDFHAVLGPGGGSQVLFAEQNECRVGRFKLLYPGLFIYHCAAAPIPMHIANGMYGLLLVEPDSEKRQLPKVDREFYVLQSEFYTEPSTDKEMWEKHSLLEYSYSNGLDEKPQWIVFNGKEGALTDAPLKARVGECVRIYFGNAGPNLISSFHVIGCILDRVYRDGGLIDPPSHGLQTVLVPPGGAVIVELECRVPGTFTLLDHAIHRIDKGAVGYLKVAGEQQPDIYAGEPGRPVVPCPGCKVHE